MDKEQFDQMVVRLKNGDNTALVGLTHLQKECMIMLTRKSGGSCRRDDAYDIYVDSVLDFRKNILNDQVVFGNMKAYFLRICWNKWLAESRSRKRKQEKNLDIANTMYELQPDSEVGGDFNKKRLNALQLALKTLSEQCNKILKLAIVEGKSMNEIATILGLANANVAKTTKSRCNNKLMTELRKMRAI